VPPTRAQRAGAVMWALRTATPARGSALSAAPSGAPARAPATARLPSCCIPSLEAPPTAWVCGEGTNHAGGGWKVPTRYVWWGEASRRACRKRQRDSARSRRSAGGCCAADLRFLHSAFRSQQPAATAGSAAACPCPCPCPCCSCSCCSGGGDGIVGGNATACSMPESS
jgi:hypothetical protein